MNAPESRIPDEMLSAYLDGELSPLEVQEVAAALEQSEELRVLMADLKLIRTEIQSLPKHTLSPDFATRVAESCSRKNAAMPLQDVSVARAPERHSRWRIIAVVAAVAASLLIALFAMGPGDSSVPIAKTDFTKHADVLESVNDADLAEPGIPIAAMDSMPFRDAEAAESNMADGGSDDRMGAMGGGGIGLTSSTESNAAAEIVEPPPLDAIVRFTIPLATTRPKSNTPILNLRPAEDQLAQTEARSDDALSRNRGLIESGTQSLSEGSAIRSELELEGIAIPQNAQFFVLKGTQAEIEDAIRKLSVTPNSVEILGNNKSASALGLPDLSTVARSTTAPMGRRMMRSAIPVPSRLADAAEAGAAAKAAALPEEIIERQNQPATAKSDDDAGEEASDKKIEGRRYRILFLGQPD